MSEDVEQSSLRTRGEEALGDLAQALLENPVFNGALSTALGAGERLLRSAHDCSDGGLAVALAECAFGTGGIGAEVSIDAVAIARNDSINVAAGLFGESASRVVIRGNQPWNSFAQHSMEKNRRSATCPRRRS